MFRDRQEELQRLEEALLAEEEYDAQLQPEETPVEEALLSDDILDALLDDTSPSTESVAYQNFSNAYGRAYNSDTTDVDMEKYCKKVQNTKKDHFGWLIVVCLLLILILGIAVWYVLHRGGIL